MNVLYAVLVSAVKAIWKKLTGSEVEPSNGESVCDVNDSHTRVILGYTMLLLVVAVFTALLVLAALVLFRTA
jgi:hypothetical protein